MNRIVDVLQSCSHLLVHISYLCTLYIQPIIIDAKGHLLGRLASVIAMAILEGSSDQTRSFKFFCC